MDISNSTLVVLAMICGIIGFIGGQTGLFLSPWPGVSPSAVGIVVMEFILFIVIMCLRAETDNADDY